MKKNHAIVLSAFGGLLASASASTVSVTIDNLGPAGGFSFTPVWLAAHGGSFDGFDVGAAGGAGITAIAEGGNTAVISGEFAGFGADITVAQGNGAPVFSPGESQTAQFDVGNASVNRYLSFASMVVPSNDLFFGNDDATAYELFDASGVFNGPFEILIYGRDIYDNGSEVNNASADAAFSALGGTRIAENGVITRFFDDPSAGSYLASFVNTGTADGNTIGATFDEGTLLARIRVVPAPGAAGVLAAGGVLAIRRRR
jgi:hypothetical protein